MYNDDFRPCEFPSLYSRTDDQKAAGLTTQGRLTVFLGNSTLTNANIVAQIGDTNHSKAIQYSRGLYTAAKMAAFDAESMDVYADVMGPCFDFRAQPYNSTLFGIGGYTSPCGNAVFVPYIIGVDTTNSSNPVFTYTVVFDSDNIAQGVTGNWRIFAVGNLVYVLANTNTSQGMLYAGNGLGFADYTQVDITKSNWNFPLNRIINRIVPPSASFQIAQTPFSNTFPGFQLSLTGLRAFDGCCRPYTGVITETANGPTFDNTGALNKYQFVNLVTPYN
jgi:hypothetical protein